VGIVGITGLGARFRVKTLAEICVCPELDREGAASLFARKARGDEGASKSVGMKRLGGDGAQTPAHTQS